MSVKEPGGRARMVHARSSFVCPILVGRDDLLDLADERLAAVRDGHGQLLLLAGEAGIGKTRLLGAIERRAATIGLRVVRAGTYPSDLHVPAAILLDLAAAMGRTDGFRETGRALGDLLRAAPSADVAADRRRRDLVIDVAELLAGVAANGPALIALEDLHWSDDLALEVVEALARRLAELPLLVVGTYRSDELFPRVPMRQWRARLIGRREADEVRLPRLSPDDTARMASLLGDTGLPVARDIAAAVQTRTDGIPLHVEELFAVLAAAGEAGASAVRGAEVPDTVEDAIVARLEPRSAAATQIARAGAVIGRAFDLDILAAVVEASPDALADPLAELADHFVLLPARIPGRYGFRHALICDTIYDRIPEPERRRLHARTAEAARDTTYGTDAFLALHFERAGQRAEAHAAALRGAQAAVALSANREARELFACAARTAPEALPAADRARLLEALAASAAATDDNVAASEAFEGARQAYLEAGDTLAAAAIAGPLVAVRHLLGDDLETRAAILRAALATIATPPALHGPSMDIPSDRIRGRLLAALAAAYMLDRRLDEAIGFATEARRLAGLAEDPATERNAATTLGACAVFAGRMDAGWALLEEAIAGSRAAGLDAETARGHRMIGSCASMLVEYPRAEGWLREGIDLAERVEHWNHRHYMAAHLAHVLWATGRWDAAEDVARHALADGRGGITTRVTALHALGFVALGRGRLEEATHLLDEAATIGRRMMELQRLSPALWGLAEVALAASRPDRAMELSEEALAASAVVDDAAYLFPFGVTGIRAALALGDPGAARRWWERVEPRIRARAIPGTLPVLDHGRGLLALSDGLTAQAREALAAAADGWRRRDRVWEATWALVDLARAHVRAHQWADAARLATDALREANRIGATKVGIAAAGLLATTRRDHPAEPWAPLTAREYEVARLVAGGATNAAIAARLDVSPKTVSAHVEHILAKLGMARRAEVGAWTASIAVLHSAPHGDDREE